jgi:cyclic pyranopterin phosphate synthase
VLGGDGGDCVRCNRLRLSSDGLLYPCLFSDRAFAVRTLGVREAFLAAVAAKPVSGERSAPRIHALGG